MEDNKLHHKWWCLAAQSVELQSHVIMTKCEENNGKQVSSCFLLFSYLLEVFFPVKDYSQEYYVSTKTVAPSQSSSVVPILYWPR